MSNSVQRTFTITGLHCAGCAARATEALKGFPGVEDAQINLVSKEARIRYRLDLCTPERLQELISSLGYQLHIGQWSSADADLIAEREYRRMRRATILALILAVPIMILSMGYMHEQWSVITQAILTLVVMGYSGAPFYRRAWLQLRGGGAGMDLLVSLSTLVAYLYSLFGLLFPDLLRSLGQEPHAYFEASSMIITFVLLGKLLEMRAGRTANSAIRALIGLRPETAMAITPEGDREVAVEAIMPDTLLRLRPGERIAVDGLVEEGEAYVDERMLSGEPLPRHKQLGDEVFAGTINTEGSLVYRALKTGQDTLLSRIIRLVHEAQGSRAPIQSLVDRVARVFVPVIVLVALISFVSWLLLAPEEGFSRGLVALMSVLIIACPCALGLATPIAIMVGIGRAARMGILVKNAESLEVAAHINAVVMDKTGTLTYGEPRVSSIQWYSTESSEASSILLALEQRSQHPLSKAIARTLEGISPAEIEDFTSITGRGLKGSFQGESYFVGSHRWMQELGHRPETAEAESSLIRIYIASERQLLGHIDIDDELRPSSLDAVASLHQRGIKVYMLTGDEERVARTVAQRLGLEHWRAEVLPEDKEAFVRELQRSGLRVAMVGDGINDSAALASADLSIAMGAGSDIAMESSMATLRSSDPAQIVRLIDLSAATLRTIRGNLFWAFAYNVLAVPVAAGVLIPLTGHQMNPMLASLAMTLSSLSVVGNSLRLGKVRL